MISPSRGGGHSFSGLASPSRVVAFLNRLLNDMLYRYGASAGVLKLCYVDQGMLCCTLAEQIGSQCMMLVVLFTLVTASHIHSGQCYPSGQHFEQHPYMVLYAKCVYRSACRANL